MHERTEDLQGLASPAPAARWGLAALALIALAGVARADPAEHPRPITTHLGWTVDLDSFVQLDLVPWSQHSFDEIDPATGDPLNETTMYVRRALVRAEARQGRWTAELELGGDSIDGPKARLVGARMGWSYPGPGPGPGAGPGPGGRDAPLVTLTGGLIRIPFGAAVQTDARDRVFVELPTFLQALFPGEYDAGLRASGAYGLLRWSVAAMDGAPTKDAQWQGRDPSESFDFLGRIGAVVALPRRAWVEAGVSALTGRGLSPGTPATKDTIQWVDENEDGIVGITEIRVVPGMTALASSTFHHDALGGDLAIHWCLCKLGKGTLTFEAALATNLDRAVIYADPVRSSRQLRELGYAIGVVQELGPYVLAGVRYDRYDADRDAADQAGVNFVRVHATFATLAVMAAVRAGSKRLTIEYDHNQNPLGLDASGSPSTAERDRLTLRGQVEF